MDTTVRTDFTTLASDEQIESTARALEANEMRTIIVENGDEARRRVLELIRDGAEVFTATSRTLDSIGLAAEINESPRFRAVRTKMAGLDRMKERRAIAKLSAAPDVVVGSVHAITEQGQVMVASFGGSQISP